MFEWIAKVYLRNRIARDNAARKKQFLSWEKIEKIALILDQKDKINKSEIDKFLESTKKFVDVFYIELSSQTPSFGDWRCFSKKDRSILRLPKGPLQEEIRKKKFDVVINTSGGRLFSYAIAASLQAPFKCGDGEYNSSDLIVTRDEKTPLIRHLNDVVTYLKMIRTT